MLIFSSIKEQWSVSSRSLRKLMIMSRIWPWCSNPASPTRYRPVSYCCLALHIVLMTSLFPFGGHVRTLIYSA